MEYGLQDICSLSLPINLPTEENNSEPFILAPFLKETSDARLNILDPFPLEHAAIHSYRN